MCGWRPWLAVLGAWTQGPPPGAVGPGHILRGCLLTVLGLLQPALCCTLHVSRPLCCLHVRVPQAVCGHNVALPRPGWPRPSRRPSLCSGRGKRTHLFMAPPRPLPVTAPALLLCGFSLGPGSLLWGLWVSLCSLL